MDNSNDLPVDAVHGKLFPTSVNSEPWPTESENADTFAEKVLPIDAQLKSSIQINYPGEFPNNEELIVKERPQAPFDFDKHIQCVITNHDSIPNSLISTIRSTMQDVLEDSTKSTQESISIPSFSEERCLRLQASRSFSQDLKDNTEQPRETFYVLFFCRQILNVHSYQTIIDYKDLLLYL